MPSLLKCTCNHHSQKLCNFCLMEKNAAMKTYYTTNIFLLRNDINTIWIKVFSQGDGLWCVSIWLMKIYNNYTYYIILIKISFNGPIHVVNSPLHVVLWVSLSGTLSGTLRMVFHSHLVLCASMRLIVRNNFIFCFLHYFSNFFSKFWYFIIVINPIYLANSKNSLTLWIKSILPEM